MRTPKVSQKFRVSVFIALTFLGGLFCAHFWISSVVNDYYDPTTIDRRNAHNLAAVCFAAEFAGLPLLDENSLQKTIENISKGSTVDDPNSPFFEIFFGVPNLNEEDQRKAANYLGIQDGQLVYQSLGK